MRMSVTSFLARGSETRDLSMPIRVRQASQLISILRLIRGKEALTIYLLQRINISVTTYNIDLRVLITVEIDLERIAFGPDNHVWDSSPDSGVLVEHQF